MFHFLLVDVLFDRFVEPFCISHYTHTVETALKQF